MYLTCNIFFSTLFLSYWQTYYLFSSTFLLMLRLLRTRGQRIEIPIPSDPREIPTKAVIFLNIDDARKSSRFYCLIITLRLLITRFIIDPFRAIKVPTLKAKPR